MSNEAYQSLNSETKFMIVSITEEDVKKAQEEYNWPKTSLCRTCVIVQVLKRVGFADPFVTETGFSVNENRNFLFPITNSMQLVINTPSNRWSILVGQSISFPLPQMKLLSRQEALTKLTEHITMYAHSEPRLPRLSLVRLGRDFTKQLDGASAEFKHEYGEKLTPIVHLINKIQRS